MLHVSRRQVTGEKTARLPRLCDADVYDADLSPLDAKHRVSTMISLKITFYYIFS